MEYDVEGDVDVRTFLGLAGPRAGFTAIRVTGRVASPNAADHQLQELCTYVQETSPVRDSLANPIPVRPPCKSATSATADDTGTRNRWATR
jgi:organic hydroperoxide reductase OsmC/OhrA